MLQENDDMDELLRRAAENYPLKTDGADWEKVRLALDAEVIGKGQVKNKNYRSLWLLLLLLPLGWAGYHYISSSSTPVNNTIAVKDNKSTNNKISQPVLNETNTNEAEKETTKNINPITHTNQSIANQIQSIAADHHTINITARAKTSVSINQPEADEVIAAANEKNIPQVKNEEKIQTPINSNDNNKEVNQTLLEEKNISLTTDKTKNNNQTAKKDSKTNKQKNNFLYAGVIVAPEISTVKFQSIKNTGVNMGVLLGYQVNKKLSIETGLMWDKKFYYSEGQYFNTGKIYLPANSKISDVNGNCKMLEVPVNLNYNLKSSANNTLFTAVGLSSYFMKEEDYDYTIVSTGTPYPYNKSYKESSSYLLSVVNISAGYTRSLGKVGTLRVEPYVKIPLKGMGIGSLPITSLGVNLGLTKKIF